jgi:predicted alpha/beta-fold hydrolase
LDTETVSRAEEEASADRPFRPRFPWLTGDLQTIRNMVVRPRFNFADAPARRLEIAMADGTGDTLIGFLHAPRNSARRPLALLIHGLTGDSESFYIQSAARALLDASFPVLRINLRGAGASAGLCREQYHAGRSADFCRVIEAVPRPHRETGLVVAGFSLGGNTLLKLLGEVGAPADIRAAAAISPPVDLASAAVCIRRPRNALYQRYLLAQMKQEARRCRDGLPPAVAGAVAAARNIVAFDDTVVAPRYGFASAADYYARSSAQAYASAIRTPTLVVHACDDPWIPPEPFGAPVWTANPALHLVLSRYGGHVGFHAAGTRRPWHDDLLVRFFLEKIGK